MPYRLGLDIGTNSVGWCLLDIDADNRPRGIRDMGVRIFTDGRDAKTGTSLAADRRGARGMRRRRDRYLLRRDDLMKALVRHGLMPRTVADRKKLEALDPYELRARGLDQALTPHELGRALFHLHQRRGFRSNRKTDSGDDEGKIKQAVSRLRQDMEADGARSLGEYLNHRHSERMPVRARLNGSGADAAYELYPERAMVEAEFDTLWNAQAAHHPELTHGVRDELHGIMFRQRPLREVEPGRCTFNPDEPRAPRALPLAQQFRIYQELANLRVILPDRRERRISIDERNTLAENLFARNDLTFERARALLDLPETAQLNLASERRDRLKGDETAKIMAHRDRFGKAWRELSFEEQTEIVERLLEEQNPEKLVGWLIERWDLDEVAADAVSAARLPQGYSRLGLTAMSNIVAALREGADETVDPETGEIIAIPLTYSQAVVNSGYHHSDLRPDELRVHLPYYGTVLQRYVSGTGGPNDPREMRHGRIANPTVHIGLNQLRRVVNAIADEHGPPTQIVVELARDLKLSQAEKQRIRREQAENQKRNEARREELVRLGQIDNGENRLRLRLWEELPVHDRRCVYSGEPLSLERLFGPAVEIDHILPFSQSLDDSAANKVLCVQAANRAKGNRTPFEVFGNSPTVSGFGYDWHGILSRADTLPPNKAWRFAPDAIEKWEANRDFLDRQLTDTAYLARVARFYLENICKDVSATPGRLTAMLRGKWGLNSLLSDHNLKNRVDHRHHAVDAFVVGLTDRAMLQRVAGSADDTRARLIENMPEPWQGFRDDVAAHLNRIVVSHRTDHGVQGRLHEETAYGFVANPGAEDGYNLVYRRPFADLNENELARIRDRDLREDVEKHVAEAKAENGGKLSAAELKQALGNFNLQREAGGLPPVRRVRLLKKEADLVAITDNEGHNYKAYVPGDNHHIDIFELPDGKWAGDAVTMFDVNQSNFVSKIRIEHPDAKFVMRVHKGDLIRMDRANGDGLFRVVRLNAKANRLYLAGHKEGGELHKRHDDPDDYFRWLLASYSRLKQEGARRVRVDELGRVYECVPFQ